MRLRQGRHGLETAGETPGGPHHANFLGYWLPIGLVVGIGMGLVTTGTSTAAALSLPPTAFAAGTGLNQTARQVGGALGIATLATLIQSGTPANVATLQHVYVFCSVAVLGAAIIGLGLTQTPLVASAVTEADGPYLTQQAGDTTLPWARFVVVGDSMAEGIGDPTPGYEHLGWADRVANSLEAEYLNLGKRNLLAAEVRATQLERALTFAPDLAAVLCGGNDPMRPDHDPEAVEKDVDGIVGALRVATRSRPGVIGGVTAGGAVLSCGVQVIRMKGNDDESDCCWSNRSDRSAAGAASGCRGS